ATIFPSFCTERSGLLTSPRKRAIATPALPKAESRSPALSSHRCSSPSNRICRGDMGVPFIVAWVSPHHTAAARTGLDERFDIHHHILHRRRVVALRGVEAVAAVQSVMRLIARQQQ